MVDRDAYVKKLQAKLDEWNAEIDKLEAKARSAQADTQRVMNERLADLRSKRDDIAAKLKELRTAGGEAWQDLKAGADLAWQSLREALESAKARF